MSQAPLDTLLEFLRFPSISTDSNYKEDTRKAAEWLAALLQKQGFSSEICPTAGHPVVLAKNEHKTGRPTVLIYGHYDVQPVDPLELWVSPPFEPRVEDGKIWARGSADNKGQHLAHVLGAGKMLQAEGDLPVNVIFLIEGEEEIGSPNLEPFLHEHRDDLKCDVIAISDTGMVGPGIPTFTYGLRGIACAEITITGPSVDLHSGIFGGAVANPATEIARLVGTLHDAEGRVAVDGFYDAVLPLESWERDAWAATGHKAEDTLAITGSPRLFGEGGYTELERRWGRPTAEVNGIGGGYQGEGEKTVLPKEAFAKLSFRLVPDQVPAGILDQVEAHFRKHCPDTVTLEFIRKHSGSAYAMDPHSAFGKAAQRALRKTFEKDIALIREGGSIPIVQAFKDVLGVDTLLLGLALSDCAAHAPNENFPVENFEAGIRLSQNLLRELAG
jgi:acetylornithine deacetylase/succinyl-diaminopimelate desuccinylase-like protein